MSDTQTFRHLVKIYIVLSEKGPVILTDNPEKALHSLNVIKNKKVKAYIRDLTTPVDRARQLAENLFERKNPFPSSSKLVEFRNRVMREWVDVKENSGFSEVFAWKKISSKYNIPMKEDEFNQWVLDLNDYLPDVDKKLL